MRSVGSQTILKLDDLMTLKIKIGASRETNPSNCLGELIHIEKELLSPK